MASVGAKRPMEVIVLDRDPIDDVALQRHGTLTVGPSPPKTDNSQYHATHTTHTPHAHTACTHVRLLRRGRWARVTGRGSHISYYNRS